MEEFEQLRTNSGQSEAQATWMGEEERSGDAYNRLMSEVNTMRARMQALESEAKDAWSGTMIVVCARTPAARSQCAA